MIDAAEALRVIGEAEEQLAGPLLDRREENRVIFVGDTHGAVDVTEAVIDKFWDDADLIVFLGDYVDRSDTSLENLGTVAASLLEDPHRTIMLRGNHESPLTNPYYGFTDEVTISWERAAMTSSKNSSRRCRTRWLSTTTSASTAESQKA